MVTIQRAAGSKQTISCNVCVQMQTFYKYNPCSKFTCSTESVWIGNLLFHKFQELHREVVVVALLA